MAYLASQLQGRGCDHGPACARPSTCPDKPTLPHELGGLFVSAGVDDGLSALAMAVQNGSQLDKLRDSARYFILHFLLL